MKIKNFLLMLTGAALMALSLSAFLSPLGLAPGGISGLAVIVNHLTSLPLGLTVLFLNLPLFLLSLKYFKKSFLLYSFLGMISLSVFLEMFKLLPSVTDDFLLAAIYGGAVLGFGMGLVFSVNYTTGGTDIAARILKKHMPHLSMGSIILLVDAVVISLSGIVFKSLEVVLYSTLSVVISTFILDAVVEGGQRAKAAYIISDKQTEITNEIFKVLDRGVTYLYGLSPYTNAKRTVILCVIKKHQIPALKQIIAKCDKCAFVIFSEVKEVLGNGFIDIN